MIKLIKKLSLGILIALPSIFANYVNAQSVTVTVTVKPNPSTVAADWEKDPTMLTVRLQNNSNASQRVRIKSGIRSLTNNSTILSVDKTDGNELTLSPRAMATYTIPAIYPLGKLSPKLNAINLSSGKFKPDNYQICMVVFSSFGSTELGSGCTSFTITEYQEVSTQTPAKDVVIEEFKANGMMFTWSTPMPAYSKPIKYKFQLYQASGGMTTPLQILATRPIVDKEVFSPSYSWTDAAARLGSSPVNRMVFMNDQKLMFVWQVTVIDVATNQPVGKNPAPNTGKSNLGTFYIVRNGSEWASPANSVSNSTQTPQANPIILKAPSNNDKVVVSPGGWINFIWSNSSRNRQNHILGLYELATPSMPERKKLSDYGNVGITLVKSFDSKAVRSYRTLSNILIPGKKYAWIVKDNGSGPTGPSSDLSFFTAIEPDYIEPEVKYPGAKFVEKVQGLTALSGIEFTWTAVTPQYPRPIEYVFNLYDENFKLISTTTVEDTTLIYSFPEFISAPRRCNWDVQARDKESKLPIGIKEEDLKGFAYRRAFDIIPNLPRPKVIAPIAPTKIAIEDMKTTGITLKWESGLENLDLENIQYNIKVHKRESRTTIQDVLDTTVTDVTELNWVHNLDPSIKELYWEVETIAPGGVKAKSDRFNFETFERSERISYEITDCDGNKKKVTNNGLTTGTDLTNKFVKIGEFSMLVTEVTERGGKYKGKGAIVISWLKSSLQVEFDGLKIDANRQVTEGEVHAIRDESITDVPLFLKGSGSGKPSKANAKKVHQKLAENSKKKMVSDQNLDDNIKNISTGISATLPLGINNLFGYTIAISEMKFTASGNTLVCMATLPINRDDGSTDELSFAAAGISFSGSSPAASGAKLVLLEDFNIVNPATNSYGIKMLTGTEKTEGTYISWGCKGFELIKASVEVSFPREWLTPLKDEGDPLPDEKVVAKATASITNLKDWTMDVSLGACEINGLEGVELSVENMVFDNSESVNAKSMEFPKGYAKDKTEKFKGFYLKDAKLRLPKFYNKGTDTTGLVLTANNFIITKSGVSGHLKVGDEENPILNLESGNVGDFQASIESVEIDVLEKSLRKASVAGKLVLPITNSSTTEKNALSYEASWTAQNKKAGATTQLTITPDGTLNTDLVGGANLDLDGSSKIELTYVKSKKRNNKGTVTAAVNLQGTLSFTKKVDKLDLEVGVEFQDLGFSYDNSKTKGKLAVNKNTTLAFASNQKKVSGFQFTINEISLTEAPVQTGFDAVVRLQMGVTLNLAENVGGTTRIFIDGGIKKVNNFYRPSFVRAGVDSIKIDAKLAAVDLQGTLVFYNDDAVYGDGFFGAAKANFKNAGQLTASVRFGSVKQNTGSFRYWYADAQMILKKAVPMVGPLGFKGAGVAAWYHMSAGQMASMDVNAVNNATSDDTDGNSGAVFTPDASVLFGFNITGIFVNTKSDKTFNGDVSFSAEFNNSGGINWFALKGSGYIGAGLDKRAEAPIKGTLDAKYDFTTKIFDLNVKVDFKTPSYGPPYTMETTTPATLTFHSEPGTGNNEALWYLHVGTPTAPNRLNYYTIPTWAYFRAGNNLIANTRFQQATIDGLRSVDPSFNQIPQGIGEVAIGGKGFDFGIGFDTSGSVNVGPFSGGFAVGAEMNLAMEQFGPNNGCVTNEFNYWYVRGNVAAWASAHLGFKGLLNINMKGAAMMQAGGPAPLWAKGRVAGSFGIKIIFITINIKASVPFTYGTVCRPKRELAISTESGDDNFEIDANDLVEIGDFAMHESGATDRMSPVQVVSLIGCSYNGQTYTTDVKVMEDGKEVTKTYTVELEWYVTGNILWNPAADATWPGDPNFSWKDDESMHWHNGIMRQEGDGYSLGTFLEGDKPRNKRFVYGYDYYTYVKATLKVKDASGEWVDAKDKNGQPIKKRTATVHFKTHS